ncbi:MAG: histidinol dehydrogenase [Candidatus Hydrogenedentota bacterium]
MKYFEIKDNASFDRAAKRLAARADVSSDESALKDKLEATRAIVDDVRDRGDTAVAEYTARFDKANLSPDRFEIAKAEIDAATDALDPALVKALEKAHANITDFHSRNLRQSWQEAKPDGSLVGQRLTPIESVGVYVPGGTAFYPSSVLMNIVPARVAGVREIAMVSPPSYHGTLHPLVLAGAKIAGATRVFRVGGAQAVAALAYGTNAIPSVLKITGPGNIYVTLAKRLISSVCDIDKEAGPSEVVVIADANANPDWAAIELIAQAEHGEDSPVWLVTDSTEMANRVKVSLEKLVPTLSRRTIIEKALADCAETYVVRDMNEAARLVNIIAPEHLSIQTANPQAVLDEIPNVGCAVLGGGTSVACGDYMAGPNHILPTSRRARFASPLTAEDFRKVTSIISYSPDRMRQDADDIIRLASAEKLDAHARALELRK